MGGISTPVVCYLPKVEKGVQFSYPAPRLNKDWRGLAFRKIFHAVLKLGRGKEEKCVVAPALIRGHLKLNSLKFSLHYQNNFVS